MNLLLLEPSELDTSGEVLLEGPRARHLLDVLRVQVGKVLRAGCLDQSYGQAQVLHATEQQVRLRYVVSTPVAWPAAGPERCLLLAIPRAKVLSRCLEHAAALGFTRIALFRSARVDKSQLQSHKLSEPDMRGHLLAGLEQGCRVVLPRVQVFERFRPFVEDELTAFVTTQARVLAHVQAPTPLSRLPLREFTYCVALGPEGGFVPFEVTAFEAQGFTAAAAPIGPLRVESALSYLTGQLDLLAATAGAASAQARGGSA